MFVSYDSPSMVDVIAKRVRQIVMHGYTSEHDDHHTPAQLLAFGGITWENPTRSQLVSAGACVLAAIDRMDRDDALTMTTNESAPDPTAGVWPKGRLVQHPQPGKVWVQVPHRNDIGSDWIEADVLPATPDADDASTDASEPLAEAEIDRLHDAVFTEGYEPAWQPVREEVERIVAAREAAAATKARADERERIAQAIEALPGPNLAGVALWRSTDAREGYLLAIEEAATAARIYRDGGR